MSAPDGLPITIEPVKGRRRRCRLSRAETLVDANAVLIEEEYREGAWRVVGRKPLRRAFVDGEPLASVLNGDSHQIKGQRL